MTTHILIVDDSTFKQHLEYMFIGTGTDKPFGINNGNIDSSIHSTTERTQAGIAADCCRMRDGDLVIFYSQQSPKHEGTFFGLFKVKAIPGSSDVAFTDTCDDKYPSLTKSLQYRALIEPYDVYATGVSEWEALDEIKHINNPSQMLWSLIYRKLKGNRGNTMITLYESRRLINLIQTKNNGATLRSTLGGYSYDPATNSITKASALRYNTSRCTPIDISDRLIEKFSRNRAHEVHLQAFITKNIGTPACQSLNKALFSPNESIIWLGNEVSCGVGMQRMDVVVVTKSPDSVLENLYIIELKCVEAEVAHVNQMYRYIEWLSQYYTPNHACVITPVLLTRASAAAKASSADLADAINKFSSHYKGVVNMKPFKTITYDIVNNKVTFV